MFFYVNFACACASSVLPAWVKRIEIPAQVSLAVLYVLFSASNDYLFWYTDESFRRKSAIENAYAFDLKNLQTDGYYNNSLVSPTIKYALNAFESVFFSRSIVRSTGAKESIKSILTVIVFIASCLKIKNGEIVLLVSQTVFSSTFIIGAVGLCFYQIRLETLYNEFYHEFVTVGISKNEQVPLLLSDTVEYFFKLNLKFVKNNDNHLTNEKAVKFLNLTAFS